MVSQVHLVPLEAPCTVMSQAVTSHLPSTCRVLPLPGEFLLILQGPAQIAPLRGASPGRSSIYPACLLQSWVSILSEESPVAELWDAQGAVRGGWLWILTHLGSNPGFLICQLVTLSLIICDRELGPLPC